jgi:carbamoyltransferase
MNYLLGLNCYSHDASAALIRDGEVVALVEEERLNREKHTWRFPERAIRQCLIQEGISGSDVPAVTFFFNPLLEILGNFGHFARYFPRSLRLLAAPSGADDLDFLSKLRLQIGVRSRLAAALGLAKPPPLHFVEHHLCHAASAFFLSDFDNAAILTMDGRGESASTLIAVGEGTRISKLREIKVPHSLGYLYAAVTDHLGFRPFRDEWKVMGLAAYGTDRLQAAFDEVIELTADGGFRLNLKFFDFHTHGRKQWVSHSFQSNFGPKRLPSEELKQEHYDLAFAAQRATEKIAVHLACRAHELTGKRSLCVAGGVALNVLTNSQIVRRTPFENFFFQPLANDAGTSLGSALYHYHSNLGMPRGPRLKSVYLGPSFSDTEMEGALLRSGLKFRRSQNVCEQTAHLIHEGKVVAWFQGRMEAGPRALGNRSILADPSRPDLKERLNRMIKKREAFRPFAPSVLAEIAHEFFDVPRSLDSPYMMLSGKIRDGLKDSVPAVVHVDQSSRVHTVRRETNPRFWELIREFERLSSLPLLLNTSFNEDEPIVCSPEDAISCYLRTGLDALVLGDFICLRGEDGRGLAH